MSASEQVRHDQRSGELARCPSCKRWNYIPPAMQMEFVISYLAGEQAWRGVCCARCGAPLELEPPVLIACGERVTGEDA